MKQPRARATMGAALAVLAAVGLSGCQNPGTAAAQAVTGTGPKDHHGGEPTKRAAHAFVVKTFRMLDKGQALKACHFSESKPYLAMDPNCVAHSRQAARVFHAHGLSLMPQTIRVDLHGTRGTETATWVVNGASHSEWQYLRFDGKRWWFTGGKQEGDRGL